MLAGGSDRDFMIGNSIGNIRTISDFFASGAIGPVAIYALKDAH